MVKRSWVLVTSTHVTDLLKCASVVGAACLVPITPCSKQWAQTAITRGWNGRIGLKMVKQQKGPKQRQYDHTWMLLLLEINVFNCCCTKWNIHLQGSRTALNSRFDPKIFNLSRNKLQPFIHITPPVLYWCNSIITLQISVTVKFKEAIKGTIPP